MAMDKALRKALGQITRKREDWEKRKTDFLKTLPESYPAPRAEQEWQAHKRLRQHWSGQEIGRFVETYGTDEMVFPGTLDAPGHPSLTEFMHDVGLLAGGEYARTLPRTEMLKLIAGEEAARGDQFIQGPKKPRRDPLTQLIDQALTVLPQGATANVLHKLREIDGGRLIQEIDPEDMTILWHASGRERETSFKSFQNRISARRRSKKSVNPIFPGFD